MVGADNFVCVGIWAHGWIDTCGLCDAEVEVLVMNTSEVYSETMGKCIILFSIMTWIAMKRLGSLMPILNHTLDSHPLKSMCKRPDPRQDH